MDFTVNVQNKAKICIPHVRTKLHVYNIINSCVVFKKRKSKIYQTNYQREIPSQKSKPNWQQHALNRKMTEVLRLMWCLRQWKWNWTSTTVHAYLVVLFLTFILSGPYTYSWLWYIGFTHCDRSNNELLLSISVSFRSFLFTTCNSKPL